MLIAYNLNVLLFYGRRQIRYSRPFCVKCMRYISSELEKFIDKQFPSNSIHFYLSTKWKLYYSKIFFTAKLFF